MKMKKISQIAFLVVMLAGIGCSRNIPTPTIESRITGKWTMKTAVGNYVTLGVPRNATTNFTASDYFDFKADGTLSISETGKTYQGKWKVVNNRLMISETNYIDYNNGFEIKSLTTSTFQLYYTETNQTGSLEQWLNLAR